jgi:hypothetical protein
MAATCQTVGAGLCWGQVRRRRLMGRRLADGCTLAATPPALAWQVCLSSASVTV